MGAICTVKVKVLVQNVMYTVQCRWRCGCSLYNEGKDLGSDSTVTVQRRWRCGCRLFSEGEGVGAHCTLTIQCRWRCGSDCTVKVKVWFQTVQWRWRCGFRLYSDVTDHFKAGLQTRDTHCTVLHLSTPYYISLNFTVLFYTYLNVTTLYYTYLNFTVLSTST